MTIKPTYKSSVKSRSDLLTLLTEACELEHGLACSYLYAAFSLKQELSEGGLTWQQLHKVKEWASQIYLVASQEMFHLSQAWNLLSSIGGNPYYFRPNFPQNSKYYPLGLPLNLDPFNETTLKRFILFELPQKENEKQYIQNKLGYVNEDLYDYKTVGELYGMIEEGFKNLDRKENFKLFIGNPNLQVGSDDIDFPEIVKVTDLKTALKGIDKIVEQGEGNKSDDENCHYGIFKSILENYISEKESSGSNFQPVRNVISNPIVHLKAELSVKNGSFIVDSYTAEIADIFDDLYNLMLRILQFGFSFNFTNPEDRKKLLKFSIAMMPMVIKPLGDSIMLLDAGRLYPHRKAGPAFSMSRHISLPNDETVSKQVISERYGDIVERLEIFVGKKNNHSEQLLSSLKNANRLKTYL
jgi:hypothetical protein